MPPKPALSGRERVGMTVERLAVVGGPWSLPRPQITAVDEPTRPAAHTSV